jgi:hypothetical protein
MTKTQKLQQKMQDMEAKEKRLFNVLGEDQALTYLISEAERDIKNLDKEIQDETNFANENRTGAYQSAGQEARRTAKHLKKDRLPLVKILKLLKQVEAMRKKFRG